jgi:hypothetical protein
MTKIRHFLLPASAAGALLLGLTQPAAAVPSLIGDEITLSYTAPGTINGTNDTFTVVDPGIEFQFGDSSNLGGILFSGESVDFLADSINFIFTGAISLSFAATDIDGTLTGVSASVSSAVGTDSATATLLTPHSFSFDLILSDQGAAGPASAAIDLTFENPTPVPLPAGIWLMLTGLAGLAGIGAVRARKAGA